MAKRPSPRTLSSILLVGLLGGVLITQALQATASHQPADKVVANASDVEVIEPDGTEVLLTQTFKTSSPTDLLIQVTLECSILTRVVTPGDPEEEAISTGEAAGRIRVWAEFDGEIVPLNSVSSNPQPDNPSSPGQDSDKVTFCNRHNQNTLTDAEDPMDGVDEMEVYLNTKSANAFNWVFLNTGNGIHTLEVKAEFDEADPNGNVITSNAESEASGFVGNRSLIIEPTKMSNHASV